MSLPPYPKYKNSGARWLGPVPDHWAIKPLWTLFRRIKRVGYQEEQLLSVYRDHGVIPKSSRDDNNNNPSEDLSPYQLVIEGDLAINKMKAWQGSVAISEFRGIVSPAYFVYESTNHEEPRYLHYLMRSPHYITGYFSMSKGIRVGQWDLEPQYHSRMPICLPPIIEQRAIIELLERETAKIDALVEEQQRLIELLKEKRQAVISHAVTKGLNPDAPMKDSGIEWMGKVPSHWDVCALNYKYEVALGKMLDEKRITGKHLAPYLRNVDVQWGKINTEELPEMDFSGEDLDRYSLLTGDLLVCEGGEVGRAAIWREELAECFYQKALHRLRARTSSDSARFMFYLLHVCAKFGVFAGSEGKATFSHLPAETFRRYRFPFPPRNEQEAISVYLDGEALKFDELISEATYAIDVLQERRTALISAAVTGKIDVRGIASEDAA